MSIPDILIVLDAVREVLTRQPGGTAVATPTTDSYVHSPTPAFGFFPGRLKYELEIVGCRDNSMWYAHMVGDRVQLLGAWPDGWKSRDMGGYTNIIRFEDAKVVRT